MTGKAVVRAGACIAICVGIAIALLAAVARPEVDEALGLSDPGLTTRVGLAAVRSLRDLSASMTVGGLVLIGFMLPGPSAKAALRLGPLRRRALSVVRMSVWTWAISSVGVTVFTYSDLAGRPLWDPVVSSRIGYFAAEFELGQLLLLSTALVVAAGVVVMGSRSIINVGVALVISLAALWPLALTGHASGSANHDLGVNLLFFHLVAISTWVGGLGVLALSRTALGESLPTVVARYSRVAGICFATVVVSGVLSAGLRLGWKPLFATDYGALLLFKLGAVSALGVLGWSQRRRVLPTLTAGKSAQFRRLVSAEIVLLVSAIGVGVALGQTPPPVAETESVDRVEALLGGPLPPPITPARWFTQWEIDSWWAPVTIASVVLYLGAVRRLRRRGDRWPWGRTASWLGGAALMLWATSGAPGAYGEVLFSMHMVQHMTLATGVPVFLALGGPVTLTLRAVPRRTDGSMGPREWLLLVVHAPILRVLGHPAVAAALFIVSLVTFYYSGLLELSLRSHTAHLVMVTHFVLTGYLFANGVVGIDPGPSRPAHPFRVLIVMVTFGFHALFSVSLMSSTQVLAGSWFASLRLNWGRSLIDDQYLGASIGWALGDYPLAVLAGALIVSWVRSDKREAARSDRRHDRDGGAEMASYNAYLKSLSENEARLGRERTDV